MTETSDDSNVEIITETVTSIDDLPESVLTIFPNPVADVLNIELKDHEMADEAVIYTLSGYEVRREIVNSHLTTINCRNLSAGIYLMALIREGKTISKKKIHIR